MNPAARYGTIQNETASRERLMVMLFETALRHIRNGAAEIDAGRKREGAALLVKATDIVAYLRRTLDHNVAPELCANLSSVYTFVCARLIKASTTRTSKPAREAERAFVPLVDAFSQAVRVAA